jgi:hypothetical protein
MTKSRGIRKRRGTRLAWVNEHQGRHFCACGCGEAIRIRVEHFNVGIPRYRLGHNPQTVKSVSTPCACGCGEMATRGRRFISGHNSRGQRRSAETRLKLSEQKRGAANPNFRRTPHNFIGRLVHRDGYVLIHSPSHPFASKSEKVMEHRLVLEEHLRSVDPGSPFLIEVDGVKYLDRWVDVHHINGVRDDNRVANLVAMSKSDHAKLHAHQKRKGTRY